MLIGISGTLSSGKTEVVKYLSFQGFQLLEFKPETPGKIGFGGANGADHTVVRKDGRQLENGNGLTRQIDQINGSTMEPMRVFTSLDELLEFVTVNWRQSFVISHMNDMEMLLALQKRPFFLHVSIDAPTDLRFRRYNVKLPQKLTLEEFVDRSDQLLFSPTNPLIEINNQAAVKIINTLTSVKNLYIKLSELQLVNETRLRPTWDAYFMRLAELAALRSNCMKRRVGCVVVRGNRVIATGYNGTPRHLTNCNEGGCPRCNKGQGSGAALSTCLCLHAEENALLEAGRDRITGGDSSETSILYCNTCPCLTCSIKIVQSGIKEVVYAQSYSMDKLSHKVMSEAKIVLRQYSHPQEGLFI